jgi:outer membrane protein
MKNLSLALNAVLLVAVGILYYLHFSGSSEANNPKLTVATPTGVAYINTDSVLKYYEYTKVNNKKLQDKAERLQSDLKTRAAALQGEINDYQRNINSLTRGQIQSVEEGLARKEQNFRMAQQSAEQTILEEQQNLSLEMYGKITEFLKKYGQQNGLQIVIKRDQSSDLWYGDETLDITKQVIEGLNAAFKAEGQAPAKADSTAKKN